MRAIGRVYAKAVMIERLLRKTADGEGKDESILIKVINNDMLITCGQSVDNSSTKGRGHHYPHHLDPLRRAAPFARNFAEFNKGGSIYFIKNQL